MFFNTFPIVIPLVFHSFYSFSQNMCMFDERVCCDAAVSTCSAPRVAQCRVWLQHLCLTHITFGSCLRAWCPSQRRASFPMCICRLATRSCDAARGSGGPVSAKQKPAAIMTIPYRVHPPPPSVNVALLSLRNRVLNAPMANIVGLGEGLGLIVALM